MFKRKTRSGCFLHALTTTVGFRLPCQWLHVSYEGPVLLFSEKKESPCHLCFLQSDLNLQLRYLCPTLYSYDMISLLARLNKVISHSFGQVLVKKLNFKIFCQLKCVIQPIRILKNSVLLNHSLEI